MSTPQNTPSLADHISSDSPIPLADHISGPADSSDDTSIHSGSPAPSQQTFSTTISCQPSPIPIALPANFPDFNAPDSPVSEPIMADLPEGVHMMGYECYNSYNPNHHKYAPVILMPDGVMQKKPHYVAFCINTYTHHHTIVGCCDHAGDPLGDHGEDLYAAPNWDPMPNLVDDNDLTLFTPTHPDAQAVDIATSALKDPGVTANIDRYRVLWDVKGALEHFMRMKEQASTNGCSLEEHSHMYPPPFNNHAPPQQHASHAVGARSPMSITARTTAIYGTSAATATPVAIRPTSALTHTLSAIVTTSATYCVHGMLPREYKTHAGPWESVMLTETEASERVQTRVAWKQHSKEGGYPKEMNGKMGKEVEDLWRIQHRDMREEATATQHVKGEGIERGCQGSLALAS
ncbi:hypothetical protein EDB86DRAFT_2839035 [Lactarius hatsudake]|nr:hypothetical protein EDB86DRAFT_2839035 [Lactarius hatsudake]